MINLSTNKQLNIILPNTNKALKLIIQNATPKELQSISQNKDLKSIINSLLKEATSSETSDKKLLNLVKNNPTLKNLGAVSTTIKDILVLIKLDKNPFPIEKQLKNFLVDIKDLSEPVLKEKIKNSGVFLESKLKNVQNPQVELKRVLNSLTKTLDKSNIFNVTVLNEDLKDVLKLKVVKEATNKTLTQTPQEEKKEIANVAKKLQNILPKLIENLKSADAINSPRVMHSISKLEHLVEPKMLKNENFKTVEIKNALTELSSQLSKSTNTQTKNILDVLGKIVTSIKNETSIESFIGKKLPQELKNSLDSLKNIIEKTDVLFSKEVAKHITKLSSLNSQTQLSSNNNVKEIISNDLKAIFIQSSTEIEKSQHPNKAELLKSIDKLALQIDYNQLVSHLDNSSSLYIPFSWNEMQEGEINIQKDKKQDKFHVDIDLTLKEYGELKMRLTLYDKNQLNLHIHSDNEEFKKLVKINIPSLRLGLIETKITLREIRLFSMKKVEKFAVYEGFHKDIEMGFEVKA